MRGWGKRRVRLAAAILAGILSLLPLLLLAGCGEKAEDTVSPEETRQPAGSPLRAIFPLEEIRMSFPGGSGTVTFRYEKETRSAVRETVLQENSNIPALPAATYQTVETYHFTGDGLPETYQLIELSENPADAAAATESGGEGVSNGMTNSTPSSTRDGGTGDEPENMDSGETGTEGTMLLSRRFFYEDGRLSSLVEERPGEGSELSRVYKEFKREPAGAGFITGAVLYETALSPLSPPEETVIPPADTTGEAIPFAEERFAIGTGGLPMEFTGAEGEKLSFTYRLDGRTITRRSVSYAYGGVPLWDADFRYGYDAAGRVERIDWTIRYVSVSVSDGASDGTSDGVSGGAVPAGALLPAEGGYSMTLRYAEGVPSYLAAVCEELRLGSLEQGYSADLFLPVLAPGTGIFAGKDPPADE